MRDNLVIIEETKFIYKTNFSGDPDRDTYGNTQRKGNLIIPDIEQARRLIDEGFNVKLNKAETRRGRRIYSKILCSHQSELRERMAA